VLGRFFQCDPDIRLSGTDIYFDSTEPRPVGVVSHGHADHIGRHDHFIATRATAAFLRIRHDPKMRGVELPFRAPHLQGEHRITLHPAGHVLGSAMVRAEANGESLLYTGDFRLKPSFTAEPAEIVPSDAVIMESTYGSPEWSFPCRGELRERLQSLVRAIVRAEKTAVLLAYSLGKAQEVHAMLEGAGVPIVLHPVVAKITEIYRREGVHLPANEIWSSQQRLDARTTTQLKGKVVIFPPHMKSDIRRIPNRRTIALTGWSLHHGTRGADEALPLSDHGDFHELIEFAERSQAKTIFVTHGSKIFARELKRRGFNAQFLLRRPQMRLF
jgi:putative mRNA 3-end processing factor